LSVPIPNRTNAGLVNVNITVHPASNGMMRGADAYIPNEVIIAIPHPDSSPALASPPHPVAHNQVSFPTVDVALPVQDDSYSLNSDPFNSDLLNSDLNFSEEDGSLPILGLSDLLCLEEC
jgi:hypothetical protein